MNITKIPSITLLMVFIPSFGSIIGSEKSVSTISAAKLTTLSAGALALSWIVYNKYRDLPIHVHGYTVYIRGVVIDGIPKLGTMFIK